MEQLSLLSHVSHVLDGAGADDAERDAAREWNAHVAYWNAHVAYWSRHPECGHAMYDPGCEGFP